MADLKRRFLRFGKPLAELHGKKGEQPKRALSLFSFSFFLTIMLTRFQFKFLELPLNVHFGGKAPGLL